MPVLPDNQRQKSPAGKRIQPLSRNRHKHHRCGMAHLKRPEILFHFSILCQYAYQCTDLEPVHSSSRWHQVGIRKSSCWRVEHSGHHFDMVAFVRTSFCRVLHTVRLKFPASLHEFTLFMGLMKGPRHGFRKSILLYSLLLSLCFVVQT